MIKIIIDICFYLISYKTKIYKHTEQKKPIQFLGGEWATIWHYKMLIENF